MVFLSRSLWMLVFFNMQCQPYIYTPGAIFAAIPAYYGLIVVMGVAQKCKIEKYSLYPYSCDLDGMRLEFI